MTETLAKYINSHSGMKGLYVNAAMPGSVAGQLLKEDDQLLKINGYDITPFGQCIVPWSKGGPVDIACVMGRFKLGDPISVEYERNGSVEKGDIGYTQMDPRIVRPIYWPYQVPVSAVYAGMVVQELNLNLVALFSNVNPLLGKYLSIDAQCSEPALIVSYVLDGGIVSEKGQVSPAMTLNSVNGKAVRTLKQLLCETQKESAFYKIGFHDNINVIISNKELVMDHEFISSTFGNVLKNTALLPVVACLTDACACEDIGCSKCSTKHNTLQGDVQLIQTKTYAPGKTHTKGKELEKLLINTPDQPECNSTTEDAENKDPSKNVEVPTLEPVKTEQIIDFRCQL